MTAPAVFLLVGTVAIAVNFTTEPMDLWNLQIGNHYIATSVYSLTYAIKAYFIALASVSCLYFLSLTTPMLDLVQVMKKCKLPWLFVELTILMYRFIFVIGDMAAAYNAFTGLSSWKYNIEAKDKFHGANVISSAY